MSCCGINQGLTRKRHIIVASFSIQQEIKTDERGTGQNSRLSQI
jgi:hypothetical protein